MYIYLLPSLEFGIFKHQLRIIVAIGKLLIKFFHGSCYVSMKYDLIGN